MPSHQERREPLPADYQYPTHGVDCDCVTCRHQGWTPTSLVDGDRVTIPAGLPIPPGDYIVTTSKVGIPYLNPSTRQNLDTAIGSMHTKGIDGR